MRESLLRSYEGQVKIFLVLLVLFLAVAIYFNFHLLVIARNAIQDEVGRRLGLEADLVRTELERDQMLRGLNAGPGEVPYIPPTYLDRYARLKGMVGIEILALDGRVLSSTDPERIGQDDPRIADPEGRERQRLGSGGTVVAPLRRLPGTRYATLAAYRPIQDRSRRSVAYIRVEQEVPLLASVDFNLRTIATIQAGGLVFVLVLVILFARWLLTPYRRLQRAAGEAPGVIEGLGISPGRGDETDQLVGAFRGVIDKLREQENELQALKTDAGDGAGTNLFHGDDLIAGMSSAVLVLDRRGRLSGLNGAAERLLGLSRPESLGRNYAGLLKGNARLIGLIGNALSTGKGRSREVVPLLAPGGKTTHLGVMISPVRASDGSADGASPGEGVLCLLTDLTEIKTLRERVGMKENLAALGEMSAGIAHEFRNSLATIQGYARLLAKRRNGPGGDATGEHAGAILREIGGIRKVIDDFLRFARPLNLDLAEVDLRQLVDDLLADFRADPLSGDIRIEVAGSFPSVIADEALIRQALLNLLRNAAEAVPGLALAASGGGGQPEAPGGCIVVEGEPRHGGRGGATISIRDNGPGIGQADRAHIFTPFYTTKEGGTGLGLALVQKIAVMHDGQVEVESVPGAGTCVRFKLPGRPGDGADSGTLF